MQEHPSSSINTQTQLELLSEITTIKGASASSLITLAIPVNHSCL
jgi:hypothetical protein